MRGDPQKIDRTAAEQSRLAREQHREPDGWERDARADAREEAKRDAMAEAAAGTQAETLLDGIEQGRQDERLRILTALSAAEQETAAMWQEGSAVTRAVAAYTARVRAIVEGRT